MIHDINYIKEIIYTNGDVNQKDMYGFTPLLIACSEHNKDKNIVESLLDKGADINHFSNDKRYTPLSIASNACYNNSHYDIIKLLLERGARINDKINNKSILEIFLQKYHIPDNTDLIFDMNYLKQDPKIIHIIKLFFKYGLETNENDIRLLGYTFYNKIYYDL